MVENGRSNTAAKRSLYVPTRSPPRAGVSLSEPRVSSAKLLAYGAPIFGVSYLLFFLQFYFLKFATDVLLLSPAIVGVLFSLAKLWDGVNGPLVGSFSDRSRSRFGRRRPFLFAALLPLAIGFVMLWTTPRSLEGPALIAWIAVALFVFYTAFDVYTLPHQALGAELSRDPHQRTRLFAVRQMSFTFGIMLAFGGIQIAMNAEDPRAMAAQLAIPAALVCVVLLAITPLVLREPTVDGARGGTGVFSALRDVISTRAARQLLFVNFVESAGVGAVGTMAPYIAEYLLGRPDIVGLLPAAYVISAVVSIPIWVRISKSFGKRDTWLAAMAMAACAFGGMWFVGKGDVTLVMTLLVFAGSAMGCGGVLANAILADVIDLDERRTGERKEGVYSAAMVLVLKVGTSLATAASGVVMTTTGFVPNVAQSDESLFGIRLLFAGLPCLGFVAGALLFRNFTLDDGPGGAPSPTVVTAPSTP
jgi:GPH family glycoside/pentoside/hexuronide:cation symporter